MTTSPADQVKVAFLGVGRMGAPMLKCVLEKGFQATLYDPFEQALAPFITDYPQLAQVAASPAEAARAADVIEIVVNTNEQLLEACLGPNGVFAGCKPGSIVLVHSTVSHETLEHLGKIATEQGVHVLDAMVSGAMGHLSIPNLAVMVGGDRGSFVRAKPVMDTYGSMVLHLGEMGAGLDAKLAINLLRYLSMLAGTEAARLADHTGLSPETLSQLVAHTQCNAFFGNFPKLRAMAPADPKRKPQVDSELAQKDLKAALQRAAKVGLQLPTVEFAVGRMPDLWGAE